MKDMEVPILKMPFTMEDLVYIADNTRRVLLSGHLTMGPYTEQFEKAFAEFAGVPHAIATSSATSAIEIIIRALEIEGRTIIVPTNTFFATALAVMHSGNKVEFVDSHRETLCMDPDSLEQYLSQTDEKPAAVIHVHIAGNIAPQILKTKRICKENGIYLIEDCAHAHGCSIAGRAAGSIGIAGAFSFFPTKVLVTGEGGVITTSDERIAKNARTLRNHGKSEDGEIARPGNNWRMSEVTAVIGCQQMSRANEYVRRRREVARLYDEMLIDVDDVRPLLITKDAISSYYKYVIFLAEGIGRDHLKHQMKERGVSLTGEVYARLCHEEPIWKEYDAWGRKGTGVSAVPSVITFNGATFIRDHHICLPLYPGLKPEEVKFVIDVLRTCLKKT